MLELFVLNPPARKRTSKRRASSRTPFLRSPSSVKTKRKAKRNASPKRKSTSKRRTGVAKRKVRRRVRRRPAASRVRRRTRTRARRNTWAGQPRRHKKAATKGWSRRRRRTKGYRPAKKRRSRAKTYGKRYNYLAPGSVYNRGYRRNALLPYMAYNAPKKRKRRRARRAVARKRKRRSRRNAVLPFMAYNPVATLTAEAKRLTDVKFWTGEVLPLVGGFLGTGFISAQARSLIGLPSTGIGYHLTNIGSAAVLGAGAAMLTKNKDLSSRLFVGGLVYSVWGILNDLMGGTDLGRTLGLDGMGAYGLSNDLKHRIASQVASEVNAHSGGGVSDFLTSQDLRSGTDYLSDFATAQGVAAAPHEGGMPAPVMELEDVIHPAADAMLI